jgi:hypothetical protein
LLTSREALESALHFALKSLAATDEPTADQIAHKAVDFANSRQLISPVTTRLDTAEDYLAAHPALRSDLQRTMSVAMLRAVADWLESLERPQ